jgi:mono/diheme cytochrome c family protein
MNRLTLARLATIAAAVSWTLAAADADEPPPLRSIDAGVYTAAQADRGELVYPVACGKCHGYLLDGAPDDPDMFSTPPIGGPKFRRNWNGRSLAALYDYTRTTMPANNPGFLADQEFADILAFMLEQSGAPAGTVELRPDSANLARILIDGSTAARAAGGGSSPGPVLR